MTNLLPATERALLRRLAVEQSENRVPSLIAALEQHYQRTSFKGEHECVFAHPEHAVHLAAFLNQQPLGVHVSVDDAGRLQLHAFLGVDSAADFAADNRLATDDVAFDFPAPCDEHLFSSAHGSADRPFYLYDAIGGTWSPTGSLNDARWGAAAVRLSDGKVLVAGG